MKKPYLSFTGSEVQLNSDHILLLKEYNESQLYILGIQFYFFGIK